VYCKGHPLTGHEITKGRQKYNPTPTHNVGTVRGGQRYAPALYQLEMDPVFTVRIGSWVGLVAALGWGKSSSFRGSNPPTFHPVTSLHQLLETNAFIGNN
jgi:hypothetical protein